jgi:hypothetical protein
MWDMVSMFVVDLDFANTNKKCSLRKCDGVIDAAWL